MATETAPLPSVFLGVPAGRQTVPVGALFGFLGLHDSPYNVSIAARGTSCLPYSFNLLWAQALNLNPRPDYFVMLHDDIEPKHGEWLTLLLDQLRANNLDVLGAAIAIKDSFGLTSIAADTHAWRPRRITLKEIHDGPELLLDGDCRQRFGGDLLLNTGMFAMRFAELADFVESFVFTFENRIVRRNGRYEAQMRPEDWLFSRACHRHGLRLAATRTIKAVHHGTQAYTNERAWGSLETDSINLPFVGQVD